jgi:eukaryotic-like serine/threonine-protein kinase
LATVTTVSTGGAEPRAIGANDQDLAVGQEVGEYRIESTLGKGGFGTVYGAVHPLIGKRVAIKVLARKYSADEEIVSRFVAEARAVNQIRHRNIIDIFSFGALADGRHYYVMEYLDGEPLDVHIRNHGPMPLDEAIPVLRSIARALDAAHAKGIAHRDLKPENIFLAQDADGVRFPKLLDFGIAKLLAPDDDVRHKTGTGVPIGTPYYMSPEQCRGREVDHRTDIYSFGIVTYRLLTGTYPFEGDDYMELLVKQMNDEPPAPSSRNEALTPAVDEAIAWMMRKDRAQRPPNVIEGVNALDPTQAMTPASLPKRSSRPTAGQPEGPIAVAKLSSPDALAATFTPEFERVPISQLASPRRRMWPLLAAGVAVVAAGAIAAFVALRSGGHSTSSAPVATPAPVPVVDKAPVAPPIVETPAAVEKAPEPAPPTQIAPPPFEPVAQPAPQKTRPRTPRTRPATGSAQATQPHKDPGDAPPAKGDVIHLGSDAFGKEP